MRIREVLEERMLAKLSLKGFDRTSSPPCALRRMARTSSVMSMPTGHHVMQRPHPTQPELPNWSCHEASLWVIHWR